MKSGASNLDGLTMLKVSELLILFRVTHGSIGGFIHPSRGKAASPWTGICAILDTK